MLVFVKGTWPWHRTTKKRGRPTPSKKKRPLVSHFKYLHIYIYIYLYRPVLHCLPIQYKVSGVMFRGRWDNTLRLVFYRLGDLHFMAFPKELLPCPAMLDFLRGAGRGGGVNSCHLFGTSCLEPTWMCPPHLFQVELSCFPTAPHISYKHQRNTPHCFAASALCESSYPRHPISF